ncbi:MAG TPA: alanine--glyoxylate aminotransferase family protein [Anaerolineaceae bacterium]|nr:alanine--glyoxylate aminotransferase family protein [Anaerolineales bacterium]HIQ09754.1 alanine--glyoxylate aminotransferase family protein [Anaerolineaceae bacterium]
MSPMFVPGPVDVADEVLQAQAQPILPHRSAEFETIFHRAEQKARKLFYTQYRVFITASSGTGLQEAAVRNFAKAKVLACVNGAFGARWAEVARTNGKEVTVLEAEWGQPILPEQVAEALKKDHFEIVTVVHNETSVGLENPIKDIAAAVREVSPDTLICVDAVSSLGGAKLEMDAWGLDMVLTSSQKCLALPPGLALGAVSDRAMERAKEVPHRGWYFDFLRLEKHRLKDSTPATPAISLIYALDLQLDRILAEGLENRFARHTAMAQRVQSWALERGFSLFAAEGYRSKTVTTIRNDRGLDVGELNRWLLQRDMRIANGYGPLKGKTFRIAHMGELQMADIEALLSALDEYLRK